MVAITAATPARNRGRLGLQALRDTLAAVEVDIIGGEPIPRGPPFETEAAELLAALIDRAAAASQVT